MVDAGTDEIELVFGNIDVAADQVQGRLHAVTEADELRLSDLAEGRAVGPHRIRIVQQDRIGT